LNRLLICLVIGLFYFFFFDPMIISGPACQSLQLLPVYVTQTPKGHFVGISEPGKTIQSARQSAFNNAMEQIIRDMGATYNLSYKDRTYGRVAEIKRDVEINLTIMAEWFIREVEQNMVRSDMVVSKEGNYTFFTLIHFPDAKIEKMKKLTLGPKIAARVLGIKDNTVKINIAETNAVTATFYEYQINDKKSYTRANFISYYIWKVPESKFLSYKRVFEEPIVVNLSSRLVEIPISCSKTGSANYFSGFSKSIEIDIIGYDEVGREIIKTITIN
jgi:hypothetical protein